MRVLVVDDEPSVRLVLQAMLEAEGHQVTEAADATQALTLLATDRFELLVTDQRLPDALGTDLAMIAKGQRPPLPVILLTGDVRRLGMAVPPSVDVLLEKPVPFAAVRDAVWRACPEWHQPHAAAG